MFDAMVPVTHRWWLLSVALLVAHAVSAQSTFVRVPSTESSIGVWYAPDAPADGRLWRKGDRGQRLYLRGRVITTLGFAVEGAVVEVWHADSDGAVHQNRFRARLKTPANGEFRIDTVLPGYIWGPRHIHVMISHPDHPRFITRIFFRRDPEVAISGRPELAIALEDAERRGARVLLGRAEFVLHDN